MRRLLLRLPLLLVLAVAAWLLLGDRPRRVDLVYDLRDPQPVRVVVRIEDAAGRTQAELAWGDGRQARDPMPHHPLLAPGEHRLVARLEYADGRTADIERRLAIEDGLGTVIVHLP